MIDGDDRIELVDMSRKWGTLCLTILAKKLVMLLREVRLEGAAMDHMGEQYPVTGRMNAEKYDLRAVGSVISV